MDLFSRKAQLPKVGFNIFFIDIKYKVFSERGVVLADKT